MLAFAKPDKSDAAPLAPMSSEPALDPESIAALAGVVPDDNGAFLRELISIFLADTPPRLAEVERALAANDAASLVQAAHSIKGAAGNFGANRFARCARDIEALGKAGDLAPVHALIPELRAAYDAVRVEMERIHAS